MSWRPLKDLGLAGVDMNESGHRWFGGFEVKYKWSGWSCVVLGLKIQSQHGHGDNKTGQNNRRRKDKVTRRTPTLYVEYPGLCGEPATCHPNAIQRREQRGVRAANAQWCSVGWEGQRGRSKVWGWLAEDGVVWVTFCYY